ncbi:VOC family protein [Acidisoma cellulosilytica]|uniref:VOC family protein n=1 Tax=Acidisoma cellulosilyticum TaxID=2802395 RepID=A0A964E679_9PROT|nr:VOC family protein [Acidisoma cellulosilyticum]MCB8883276.1 VOC family protein [Acidisoma cellulosilyticum]
MDFSQLQSISDICLLVQNLDRSIVFYTEKLGFTVTRRTEGFAAFNSQSINLVVWESTHVPDEPRTPSLPPTTREEHRACLSVKLHSGAAVDALYEGLAARGIPFKRPPADYPWGARCCYFSDPDNYLWEIYSDA